MPSVAFFRLTARSVLCVCMERNSLPTVPGTDNSHNHRRRPEHARQRIDVSFQRFAVIGTLLGDTRSAAPGPRADLSWRPIHLGAYVIMAPLSAPATEAETSRANTL